MSNRDLERAEFIIKGVRTARGLMKRIMEGFEPDFDRKGMNTTHFRTLNILAEKGDMMMKEVCQFLGIEAGSFTPVADKLISEGLAVRLSDERDRRRILLSLTGEGRAFANQLKQEMGKHMKKRLALLDKEQCRRFIDALETIGEVDRLLEEKSNGK